MKVNCALISYCGRLLYLALLGCALAAEGLAQVPNPGFEKGTGTTAANWIKFGNAYREALQPHTGSYTMKLFGNFSGGANVTGVYQDVRLVPGRRISASAWAINRTADAMAGDNYAQLKVIYRDANNNDLAVSESRRITAGTQRDTYQLISANLGPAPAGTHHCAVFLLFVQPASTPFASGSTVFDDVNVVISSGAATNLLWSDEFDGTILNSSFWEVMIGNGTAYGLPAGWGNNEQQYYTARPENLSVASGTLKIVARRENYAGHAFTSARIRTKGKKDFLYGRFEARIKVPAGQGLWPAFWMLPTASRYGTWAASGEIDIIETINNASTAYGTLHFGGQSPDNTSSGGSTTAAGGYATDFHIYAIDWEPDAIRWYVDGVLYFTRSSQDWYCSTATWNERAPFDDPFHLLLNLAVGGNWPGPPNAFTPFPAEMLVDWVRVYVPTIYKNPTGQASSSGG